MDSSKAISAGDLLGRAPYLAEKLVKRLTERGELIVAAESCTAGLAADLIARIPGASLVFWGSFVCYTGDAKDKMLGVPEALISKHGAVSRPVALAMAEGALEKSGAPWAFSVTGFAGPGGEAGTIWIGFANREKKSQAKMFVFAGPRNDVRAAAAAAALEGLLELMKGY